jgi:glutamate synthase (NADPH/NADH) large chain
MKMADLLPSVTDVTACEARAETKPATAHTFGLPPKQGLYDPRNEHDACGVGFHRAHEGQKSHQIVRDGLFMLENLTHRGAVGADPLMGDGAGMLVQIPDRCFARTGRKRASNLPAGRLCGRAFLHAAGRSACASTSKKIIADVVAAEGQVLIGFRDVPVDNSSLSKAPEIVATEPVHRQVFIAKARSSKAETLRAAAVRPAQGDFQPGPCRDRRPRQRLLFGFAVVATIVYKGMFLAYQVGATTRT